LTDAYGNGGVLRFVKHLIDTSNEPALSRIMGVLHKHPTSHTQGCPKFPMTEYDPAVHIDIVARRLRVLIRRSTFFDADGWQ
jgi:hypothetical protein